MVGVLSGILNGFCGIGGPPAVLYVLARNSASAELRASFILFFAVLYPVTVLTLALAGLISWQALLLSILLISDLFPRDRIGLRALSQREIAIVRTGLQSRTLPFGGFHAARLRRLGTRKDSRNA